MTQLLKALSEAQESMDSERVTIYTLGIARLLDESVTCAWCNSEANREQGTGSHGICTRHCDEMLAQRRARRADCKAA